MLTLLNEVHFWTAQDDISIKDTDFGAFKYHDRKDENTTENVQSKRLYTEKRNYLCHLTNKRPYKLKDRIKELEDLLAQNKIVYYKWTDNNILQMMLSTGVFIYVFVNVFTGDLEKISFDKFLIGKLQTSCISDVLRTRSHLLCTYNDNRITLIQFTKKPTTGDTIPQKISRLEPRIQVCELAGPAGRRLERKMSCNATADRILVWWKSSTDEVYPWSPLVKDQDRANIHIYTLYGSKLELQCFRRTEFDPLEIIFDIRQSNLIHCVEQKVSRRGTVSVEVASFEIIRNKLQQNHVTSIPLQTHVSCYAFSPDEGNKLALGCIDGSVVLFDRSRGVTSLVKAAFIPTLCSWHPSCAVLLVANERSQLQFFDVALSCIKSQTIAEEQTPSNILDLTSYFKHQPTLLQFSWNNNHNNIKNYGAISMYKISTGDLLLFLIFERGPLAVLRLFDYGGTALSPENLVSLYVQNGNIDRSLNILLSLDWNTSPEQCLAALQNIINYLFRIKFSPNVESQIQKALGSFYAPLRSISNTTKSDFGDQIADLTRKFFHTLIRHQLFEKAFCLAIDVGDHDLFMDLYHVARNMNDQEMASAALTRANELMDRENSDTDHSDICSRSSCSQCSDSSESENNSDSQAEITQRQRGIDSWTNFGGDSSIISDSNSNVSSIIPPLPNIPIAAVNNKTHLIAAALPPLPTVNINLSGLLPTSKFLTTNKKVPVPGTVQFQPLTINAQQFAKTAALKMSTTDYESIRHDSKISKQSILSTCSSGSGVSGYERVFPPQFSERRTEIFTGHNYFSNNFLPFPKLHSIASVANASPPVITAPSLSTTVATPAPISFNSTPVIIHKTVSLNIPPASSFISTNTSTAVSTQLPLKVNVPLNISATGSGCSNASTSVKTNNSEKSEKNVKFSDTVTAFIVPELPRSEKPKRSVNMLLNQPLNPFRTNPKQELQDSLPLCHPEDEYLKDFTPIANRTENTDETSSTTSCATPKIKVVHFGMV